MIGGEEARHGHLSAVRRSALALRAAGAGRDLGLAPVGALAVAAAGVRDAASRDLCRAMDRAEPAGPGDRSRRVRTLALPSRGCARPAVLPLALRRHRLRFLALASPAGHRLRD